LPHEVCRYVGDAIFLHLRQLTGNEDSCHRVNHTFGTTLPLQYSTLLVQVVECRYIA